MNQGLSEIWQNFLQCELMRTFPIQEVKACNSCYINVRIHTHSSFKNLKAKLHYCETNVSLTDWFSEVLTVTAVFNDDLPLPEIAYLGVKSEVLDQHHSVECGMWTQDEETPSGCSGASCPVCPWPGPCSPPAPCSLAIWFDSYNPPREPGGKKGEIPQYWFYRKSQMVRKMIESAQHTSMIL